MAKIELNNDQLRLIQKALDFYSRVGQGNFNEIIEHPTFEKSLHRQFSPNKPFEKIREVVCRGGRGVDGKQPLKYVFLKDIDDEWLGAIIDYEEQYRPNNKYLPIYYKELNYRNGKNRTK